jgi:peptidoglycan/LPS O-acetylase OafA/YrhL
MSHILQNWKTSGAGVTMIALAIVHLVYEIIQGSANETTWTRAITATVGGVGLIFAGDASAKPTPPADPATTPEPPKTP